MLTRYLSKDANVLCGHPQAANDLLKESMQEAASADELERIEWLDLRQLFF